MRRGEIRRIIKKLSRRRHRRMKQLLWQMHYPATNRRQIQWLRGEIAGHTQEIEDLIKRHGEARI